MSTIERLRARTDAARGESRLRSETVAYGPLPAERLEWFSPMRRAFPPRPILAMFHGGWWEEGSIDDAGHCAASIVDAGALQVSVGYTLAPNASLREIVAAAERAVEAIAATAQEHGGDPRRIVIAGHSAGAHLAASLLTSLAPRAATLISGLLLVSGAYDLAPITESYINVNLRLSAHEASALSPAMLRPIRDVPLRISVGKREPIEFHRNATLLATRWAPYMNYLDLKVIPRRDHFDVLEELDRPDGILRRDAIELLGLDARDSNRGFAVPNGGVQG